MLVRETEKLTTKTTIKEIADRIPELSIKQIEEELAKLHDTKSKIWIGKDKSNPAKIENTIKKLRKRLDKITSNRKMHYINGVT